ncbi:MAG: EAL domain-containing protein [Halieaceae bacterium]|jgi:EAL domain-containing protein (putative c-di-GMP-specific phosphodiesterase class I)/CheY-like chemotaxis protein|nr:EAL domain-containing protein [Halieaceae bacterium]
MTDEMSFRDRPTRLLILDDDPMIGATIQRIAEFDGYAVTYCEQATAFFEQIESTPPDIIALDLIMPGMNGVEVMERLVERNCRAALIVSSGVGDRVLDAARRSARENGLNVVGVLPKPFSAKTLREILGRAARAGTSAPQTAAVATVETTGPTPTQGDLRRALDAGDIQVAYQPKARCRSGTLAGFEALARWHHADHGDIPPQVFIPLAERSGLIDEVTLQVAGQALPWLAGLTNQSEECDQHDGVLHRIQLSLNISARSLTNRALFDELAALCRRNRIALDRVVLELTETSAMEDAATSLNTLTHLRLQGFSLSIDDFGTGYSSMVQLVRMPFSEIKVDKSFVMTALQSLESRAVVRSVVELGRSLGLETTAEGVEDEATLDFLKSLGCDIAQGYLLSRPLPAPAVLSWYRQRRDSIEERRLAALHRLQLLDTPPEERFDRITRLAVDLFDVRTSLVSLVDAKRQWFKSRMNFDADSTPRGMAFCNRTIEHDGLMVVHDASVDPQFRLNPLVSGNPPVRFYAGRPLFLEDGSKVGTLCLIDSLPRDFSDEDAALLNSLADLVEVELHGGLESHRNPVTGLADSAAFRFYAEHALDISRRFQLPAAMLSMELTLQAQELEDDHAASVRQRYDALARFAEAHGHGAFLIGHYLGLKIGLLYIGRHLESAQDISRALRQDLNAHNSRMADPDARLEAAVTVYDLVDYIGAGRA